MFRRYGVFVFKAIFFCGVQGAKGCAGGCKLRSQLHTSLGQEIALLANFLKDSVELNLRIHYATVARRRNVPPASLIVTYPLTGASAVPT